MPEAARHHADEPCTTQAKRPSHRRPRRHPADQDVDSHPHLRRCLQPQVQRRSTAGEGHDPQVHPGGEVVDEFGGRLLCRGETGGGRRWPARPARRRAGSAREGSGGGQVPRSAGTLGAILSSRCGSTNRRVRRLANREPIAKRGHRDDGGGEPGVARNSSDSDPACMPGVGVAGDSGAPGGTWAVGNPHVAHPARPTRNRAAPGGTAGWVARAALCVIAPRRRATPSSVTAQALPSRWSPP